MTDNEFKYWAFLSYSHQDNRGQRSDTPEVSRRCWGDWLHDALKSFSIPTEFVGQINGRGEIIPERIDSLFRDESELPGEAALSADVRHALEQSVCLIVVCSPHSAQSLPVNEAVRYFKQLGRGKHILPIVVAGEPNASDGNKPGRSPEDECFVPALRHPISPDGTLDTTRRAGKSIFVDARHGVDKREILANDHRTAEADLEMAKIQLIALLLAVGFNGLWWREQKRHFHDYAEARHSAREALSQVEAVRRQLQEAHQQTREARNQALETQNLPRDVQGQIQEAQNQALAVQNQAREAEKQLQEFQNKVRDTQTQLEEARHRWLAAESKVLEAQNQAREFQNQLAETRHQAREAQNQVLEIQNPAVPHQIQEAQNQILKAQSEAQHAQSQLEATRHQAQDAHNKFLEAQGQIQEFQNQARSAQSQLEQARDQVREAQSKAVEAQSRIQEIQSQTRAAQNQAEETRKEAREVQNQLLEAQNQARAAQNQFQETQRQGRNARRLTRLFALLAVLALLAAGITVSLAWRQRRVASQALAKAAAEAAGKFDPAPGGMERVRQVLQNIGGAEQAGNRRRSLDQLAAMIPQAEIPEALQASTVILDDQQRSHFQKWLLMRLGWVNPVSAMASADAIEGKIVNDEGLSDSSSYFQLAVLDNWMKTDLPGAVNWVCQLPDADARQCALEKIINEVQSQPDSEAKNQTLATCIEELAKTDIPQALTLAESLPEGVWRSTVLSFIAGQVDSSAAMYWIINTYLPQEIMQPRKGPSPWTKFLPNSTFGGPTILPVKTGILSDTTPGPIQLKPAE